MPDYLWVITDDWCNDWLWTNDYKLIIYWQQIIVNYGLTTSEWCPISSVWQLLTDNCLQKYQKRTLVNFSARL